MRARDEGRTAAAPRWWRGGLAGLLLGMLTFLGPLVPPAHAHDYPAEITLRVNEWLDFEVEDAADCAAFISAVPADPQLCTVTPEFGTGVSVTFRVTAGSTPTKTSITVMWVGEDVGGEGPCQEISGPQTIIVNIVALPEPESAGSFPNSGEAGDPVNTFTGELVIDPLADIDMGGPIPMMFQRHYASKMRLNFIAGRMGDNWRHNWEWTIQNNGTELFLTDPRGKVAHYRLNLGNWELQSNTDTPYEIVVDGNQWWVSVPGENLVMHFAGEGRLDEVRDGKGNVITLFYDELGLLEEVRDNDSESNSRRLLFTYDDANHVETVQARRGNGTPRSLLFQYDEDDLVSYTDACGKTTTYVYDTDHADPGLLLYEQRPEGNRPWTQTYDDVGKVATQSDSGGNTSEFDYGKPQNPGTTKVTRPDGKNYTHDHDDQGNLVSITNTDGDDFDLAADDNQRRNEVVDPEGGRAQYTYDAASGRVASFTDADGNTTEWTWAAMAESESGVTFWSLTRIDHPDGSDETFTYDAAGNRLTAVDEEGRVTTRTYDGRGNPLTETNPAGGVTTFTYNEYAELKTKETDAEDLTEYSYDEHGRIEQVDLPDGTWRQATHDLCDRRLTLTDAGGSLWEWEFDDNGNRIRYSDDEGNDILYGFDGMDRPDEITDDDGRTSSVSWDALGRFISKTDRTGATWTNGYDGEDRMTSVTDPEGHTWRTVYDRAGRIIESIDPQGRTVTYERTAEGLVSSMTSPVGRMTSFTRDARQRPVMIVDGAGRTTELAYDGSSRLIGSNLGDGLVAVTFGMDDGGVLNSITDPNGETWDYANDDAGRPVSRTDPLGNTASIAYDERDRPATYTFPGGLGTETLTYGGEGEVFSRTYSDGTVLNFSFDNIGLRDGGPGMSFTWGPGRRMSACNGMAIGRDEEGRITSLEIAPGKSITYVYDDRGLVREVNDWAGGGIDIDWDDAGRPVAYERSNGRTTDLEYDDDNRVISIQHDTLGSITLERDGAGLVSSSTRDLPAAPDLDAFADAAFTYDAASQVAGMTHDALGRVTNDGTRTYDWDLASRLESVTRPAGDQSWEYDGVGLPIRRERDGGDEVDWTWCHAFDRPSPVLESVESSPTRAWVCLPDGTPLYGIDMSDNSRWFQHYDESGNAVFLTDDSGTVTDTWTWGPYGSAMSRSGTTAAIFTWQGRQGAMDEGDGLFRMRARMYDANMGRFLSRDPVVGQTDPRVVNPYVFAAADPVNLNDPWGETPEPTETGDGATVLGMLSNGVSAFAEGLGWNNPNIGRIGWTRGGERLARGAKGLGGVATAAGSVLEVHNTNERMDQSIDRFRSRNQQIWDQYSELLRIARDLYYRKRRISRERYREIRRALAEARDFNLENSSDEFTTDSFANGTIATLNIFTGLIPGGGLVVDWADVIQH